MNLTVWIKKLVAFNRYDSKKSKKNLNFFKFCPSTLYKYPLVWAHFTPLPSYFHSLLHTHNVFIQLKWNGESTHHDVLGRHERSHEHVTSGRGRGYHRFFVNMRVKASSMIRQPWSWSGSFHATVQLLRRWLRVPQFYFRRRYHMQRTLFLSIMHKLSETFLYFCERYDATGRAGLTVL
jgi:hypothetical protein